MTSDNNGEGRDKASGRFEPGQSGNRRGRPKKPKTVGAAITGAYAEKVRISDGGKRRRLTKLELTAMQVANKSASGDTPSIKLGLDLAQKAEERQSRSPAGPTKLSETDSQIAERLMARLRQILKEEPNGHDSDSTDA